MAQESSPSSPQRPPSSDPLLASIRQIVALTNTTLATFEQSTASTVHSLASRLHALSHQARLIASRAVTAYDHRGYYGPQICAGAALLVGSVVGIRRGKVLGGLAGGVGGLMAYENVYGFDSIRSVSSLDYENWRDKMKRAGQS
jgi:hypothetical protein